MITQRIIYARYTPLFSDFTLTQTGLMQLTLGGGSFQTTGWAKYLKPQDVPPAFLTDGQAEMASDGRVRVWLQDKKTKQLINKSRRRVIVGNTVLNITSHPTKDKWYRVDLESPSDTIMVATVQTWFEGEKFKKRGPNFTEQIVLPFKVPTGTTDLSGLKIEAFTVLPGAPASTPEWEV